MGVLMAACQTLCWAQAHTIHQPYSLLLLLPHSARLGPPLANFQDAQDSKAGGPGS